MHTESNGPCSVCNAFARAKPVAHEIGPGAVSGYRSPVFTGGDLVSHRWMDVTAFNQLSAAQLGTFSLTQVRALGATPAGVHTEVTTGRWERLHPAVYGLAGHHQSWRRALWAAHLHAGEDCPVGMDSAGRIHGYPQAFRGTVDLLVATDMTRPPDHVRWFRRSDVEPDDILELPGLPPVTSPVRTVIDLAGRMHVATLRLLVEHGLVERHYRIVDLGMLLDRVRRSGKNGVRRMGQVLDDLGPGEGLSRSELERLGDAVISSSSIPMPVHEHPLPSERGRHGFVDRCWPEAKWIVELDGRKWHHRFQQALQDADRRTEAQTMGWETTQLLWEHCQGDPERTARSLELIYADRMRLFG